MISCFLYQCGMPFFIGCQTQVPRDKRDFRCQQIPNMDPKSWYEPWAWDVRTLLQGVPRQLRYWKGILNLDMNLEHGMLGPYLGGCRGSYELNLDSKSLAWTQGSCRKNVENYRGHHVSKSNFKSWSYSWQKSPCPCCLPTMWPSRSPRRVV